MLDKEESNMGVYACVKYKTLIRQKERNSLCPSILVGSFDQPHF